MRRMTKWRVAMAAMVLVDVGAQAHHLAPNLASVEHYVCLRPDSNGVSVLFDQHLDPFGARRVQVRTDLNRDGVFDAAEKTAYLRGLTESLVRLFHVEVRSDSGETTALPLRLRQTSGEGGPICYTLGDQPGEQTLRVRWTMDAEWPDAIRASRRPFTLTYRGEFGYIARLYSVVTIAAPPPPMVLQRSTVPTPEALPIPSDVVSPGGGIGTVKRVMAASADIAWSGTAAVPSSGTGDVCDTGRLTGGVAVPLAVAEGRLRERVFNLLRRPGAAAWMACLALCLLVGNQALQGLA